MKNVVPSSRRGVVTLCSREAETAFQRGLIESALEAAGGVQKRAAELLQIKPTTLNEMIKRYEIRPRRKRGGNGNGDAASAVEPPVPAESPASAAGAVPPAVVFDEK